MPKEEKIEIIGQPQSIEAEEAVLGSMLLTKEAVSKALQWLKPAMFYKDAHVRIASCMVDLFDKGEPIDAVSVVNKLKKKNELKGVGGAHYISGLAQSVPTTANIEHYAKIVLEKSILRTLISVSHDVSKNASEDNQDVDDILDDEIQDELHEYFIDSDSNEIENAIKEFDDIDEMDIRLFRIKFISELAN